MSGQPRTARPPYQPAHRLQPPQAHVHAGLSNRIQASSTSAPIYRNGCPNLHAVCCNNSDEDIMVQTDRFALGTSICEMMTWLPALDADLNRSELLSDDVIRSRSLTSLPDKLTR